MKKKGTKRKILLVKWGGINNRGGIVMLLINLLQHMDRENLDVDFYVFGTITSDSLREELEDCGVHWIAGNHPAYDPSEVAKDLNRVIKQNQYDVVHCNTGSLSLTAVTIFLSWLHRVPVRIAHSHNTKPDGGKYARREYLFQWINRRLSTVRLACSQDAAGHMFGSRGVNRSIVLKNGIEPEKYLFQPDVRIRKRAETKLDDAVAIGHVGRLERQKNHTFLIQVFSEVKKRCENAVLLLIGTGSLEDKIRAQAEQLGLGDSVRFIGDSDCVSDYLQAMDAFVFPSLYEGLGIVAIEAQAADLPTICADTVPREAAVTERCIFLPLDQTLAQWSERILAAIDDAQLRKNRLTEIRDAGYDIKQSADLLHRIYMQ